MLLWQQGEVGQGKKLNYKLFVRTPAHQRGIYIHAHLQQKTRPHQQNPRQGTPKRNQIQPANVPALHTHHTQDTHLKRHQVTSTGPHHVIRAPHNRHRRRCCGQDTRRRQSPTASSTRTFTSQHYPTALSSTSTGTTPSPPPPAVGAAGALKIASGPVGPVRPVAAAAETDDWVMRRSATSSAPPPLVVAGASTPGANSPLTYCRVIVATFLDLKWGDT